MGVQPVVVFAAWPAVRLAAHAVDPASGRSIIQVE